MSGASASAAPPEPGGPVRAAPPSEKWRRLRLIPLAAGAGALLVGLWVGLVRLGLALPGGMPALAEFHSALMISGFLGTVISLERAVAIGRWWAYTAPVLSAIGAVALIVGAPAFASGAFLLAGIGLTFNSGTVVARQPALFTVVLTVAAACWVRNVCLDQRRPSGRRRRMVACIPRSHHRGRTFRTQPFAVAAAIEPADFHIRNCADHHRGGARRIGRRNGAIQWRRSAYGDRVACQA